MYNSNKTIGIPGYLIGENTFGVASSYLEFVGRFGKPLIIMPQDIDNPPEVDLLVLPGGPDILPTTYGKIPSFKVSKPSPMLEHFDLNILPQYMEKKTPIFAICRAMQQIYVSCGGRLIQHYPWHPQSRSPEDQCHDLMFTDGFKDLGKYIGKVTSRHHQVCSILNENEDRDQNNEFIKFIPENLEIIAYSGDIKNNTYDPNIVEIFKHVDYPLYGVQWHPEDHDKSDRLSSMLVEELLNK